MTKSDYIHGQLRSIRLPGKPIEHLSLCCVKKALTVFAGGEPAALPDSNSCVQRARLCGHAFRADQKFRSHRCGLQGLGTRFRHH